ncbi:hypothetical protein BH20BAC1_BH20BAC1_05640 [soil metagenome]
MNYNELAAIWNSNNIDLEKSITINKDLAKTIGIKKIRADLFHIKLSAVINVWAGGWFSYFLVRFSANHPDMKIFIPAVLLLLVIIFGMFMEIYKAIVLLTLNARESVLEAQQKLIRLQKLELVSIYSLYISIPMFSAPFLIVAAQGIAGIDLYSFSTNWMLYYTAGSIIIAVILIYFLRKYPNKKLAGSIAFLNELRDGL